MKLVQIVPLNPRFSPGHLLITPGAVAILHAAEISPISLLLRHVSGDWGEISDSDWRRNDHALEDGTRILSAYTLPTMIRIWVITEADRVATTILLPHEY